jgi:hypothetical protein
MDAGYEYLHFLSLWQLAEAVTLVRDQGGVSDKVCVRVAQIIKRVAPELDSNGMRKVLKSFADSRHRIVHEGGDAEVSQDDCGFLRRICEAAIYWLIHNQATLPTVEHLRHFYVMANYSEPNKSCVLDVLTHLKAENSVLKK